jgi:hypothetical protein
MFVSIKQILSLKEPIYPRPHIISSSLIRPRAKNVELPLSPTTLRYSCFNPNLVCIALQGRIVTLSTYFEQ